MQTIKIQVECPVYDSFRVEQVAAMFDVPLAQKIREQFCVELPEILLETETKNMKNALRDPLSYAKKKITARASAAEEENRNWRIGLIVGPSGSGKTTLARKLFASSLYRREEWNEKRAVIDGLGNRPFKEIAGIFTAVGFSSPPSWIKPYAVLSNGEQFRCDLARALASEKSGGTVAFDEFTSVVDRSVARAVSAAIAKGIREKNIDCRFVAVSCHYDVIDWLAPDWVIDMASSTFQWRRLRRPPIELEIVRCRNDAWRLFARHHYLSGNLNPLSKSYLALWNGKPTAFCALLPLIGKRRRLRISRIVTLPDYQGIGIGMRFAEAVAELQRSEGYRVNVTASHPAVIAHCRKSPRWKTVSVKKRGAPKTNGFVNDYQSSIGRAVVSFEFIAHE